MPWLNGIAFDPAGNLYLSEYLAGKVVEVDLGTMSIQPVADIQFASSLSFDSAGNLYVYSTPAHVGASGSNKLFVIPTGGGATLVADNLPYLTDIAFLSPAATVPEPSSGLILAGMAVLALIRRRDFALA